MREQKRPLARSNPVTPRRPRPPMGAAALHSQDYPGAAAIFSRLSSLASGCKRPLSQAEQLASPAPGISTDSRKTFFIAARTKGGLDETNEAAFPVSLGVFWRCGGS